jgi:hypothetical protein
VKRLNARSAAGLAAYPDQERQDFDETLDPTAAASALRPMPVVGQRQVGRCPSEDDPAARAAA